MLKLLSSKEVAEMLGVHPNTLGAIRRRDPEFPLPIRIAHNALRWPYSEIAAWVERQERGDGTFTGDLAKQRGAQ